ncbi:autotransporter outer membrane beta-barrel domain-containing protein [Mesorhizobium sp. M0152]|uniref:autotransporter family protein n=1 Tax=Mesorhizobium sp. M0152 TaxID=2956898 RepID=UPI00333D19EE
MTGGSQVGFIYGDDAVASANDGDDTFNWSGGTLTGGFNGQNGSDTALVTTSNYDGSQVLDGGDDVATVDGWIDKLTLDGLTVSANGANIINWETVTVDGGQLTILDGALTVGSDPGQGLFLTGGGNLEALDALLLTGNLDIDAGSTFIGTGGGAGVYTVTGDVTNAGIITTQDGVVGDVFTVGGNYIGQGGQLLIDTYLGSDGSASDLLVVNGDTSGATSLFVANAGGPGAVTVGNGILVVQVDGASNGTFTLGGPAIAGAFEYRLFKNGVTDPIDGDWYLRTTYSSSTPTYEAYPQVLLELNGLPTLQQRVGNRYWNEPAPVPDTVFCKDASKDFKCMVTDDQADYYADGKATIEQNAIWARIEGAHGHVESDRSTTDAQYDFDLWKLQAGVDGLLAETDSGKLIGGINVHYGQASADTFSPNGNGDISSKGYGVGATLTWYGENGFYVDGQGQFSWYDSDLGSDELGSLVKGNNATGYALSLEAGKRIQLHDGWSLTPQAQLVYSSVDFDSFIGPSGETVSLDDGDSLKGRLGISADHERSWKDGDGKLRRTHVYGIANVYHEFLDGTAVSVWGTNLANEANAWTGELGVGGSYNWNDDKYSVYGELDASTSLDNFGDSHKLGGTLGLRVKW